MPSPEKTYPYNVIYNDGTYQTFKLTKKEIASLCQAILNGERAITTKFGIMVIPDIRTVVEYKEPPKPAEPTHAEKGFPDLDAETMEWIRQQESLAEELERRGVN